jgi:hypothetical protein
MTPGDPLSTVAIRRKKDASKVQASGVEDIGRSMLV